MLISNRLCDAFFRDVVLLYSHSKVILIEAMSPLVILDTVVRFSTYVLFTYWPMSLSIVHIFVFIRKSSDFRLRFVHTNQNVLSKLINVTLTGLCPIAAKKCYRTLGVQLYIVQWPDVGWIAFDYTEYTCEMILIGQIYRS